jgi:UDP-glucose 4-epimerase
MEGSPPVRRVVVFGGDGFIGSHLVERLVGQGHEVTVFDRFRGGEAKNLAGLSGRFRAVAGDFADPAAVAAALAGQEVAYHLVWSTTPVTGWEAPLAEVESNLRDSVRLFDLCAGLGLRKVVFVSSGGSVYGPQTGPVDENTVPRPFNPHGIAKLAAEHFLEYFRTRTGLAYDVYRVGNVFGPRQPSDRPQGVIAVWTGRILAGQAIDAYGDETTLRDYVPIEDAALLLTHSLRELAASDVFNLGTGRGTSILGLLDIFRRVAAAPVVCRLHPRRASDNTGAVLDSRKLLAHFPGFCFQGLEQGIRRIWERARAARGQG